MDAIEKALKKFSDKERDWVKNILIAIKTYNMKGLDIKKLKGHENIFRVRKGDVRIIYYKEGEQISILAIERRNEGTYK